MGRYEVNTLVWDKVKVSGIAVIKPNFGWWESFVEVLRFKVQSVKGQH